MLGGTSLTGVAVPRHNPQPVRARTHADTRAAEVHILIVVGHSDPSDRGRRVSAACPVPSRLLSSTPITSTSVILKSTPVPVPSWLLGLPRPFESLSQIYSSRAPLAWQPN